MITENDQVNNRYDAAYLAERTSPVGGKRHFVGILEALRSYADRGLIRSTTWFRSDNGLEADTRQIRNFGCSSTPGACEVRLGFA
jgi:hypothetical protein